MGRPATTPHRLHAFCLRSSVGREQLIKQGDQERDGRGGDLVGWLHDLRGPDLWDTVDIRVDRRSSPRRSRLCRADLPWWGRRARKPPCRAQPGVERHRAGLAAAKYAGSPSACPGRHRLPRRGRRPGHAPATKPALRISKGLHPSAWLRAAGARRTPCGCSRMRTGLDWPATCTGSTGCGQVRGTRVMRRTVWRMTHLGRPPVIQVSTGWSSGLRPLQGDLPGSATARVRSADACPATVRTAARRRRGRWPGAAPARWSCGGCWRTRRAEPRAAWAFAETWWPSWCSRTSSATFRTPVRMPVASLTVSWCAREGSVQPGRAIASGRVHGVAAVQLLGERGDVGAAVGAVEVVCEIYAVAFADGAAGEAGGRAL